MVVVEAGVAGLDAALIAEERAEKSCSCAIMVLDGTETIGAKTLVSAAGRCDVADEAAKPTHWLGDPRIIKNELAGLPTQIS